jgi:hypothetical protein
MNTTPSRPLGRQEIIDCFTRAGVWLGVNADEVTRNVNAVQLAIAMSTPAAPVAALADAKRHTYATIANSMIGKTRDDNSTEYVTLADAEAAVRGLLEVTQPEPVPPTLLQWALRELLGALPERRDWFNPDAEKVLRAASVVAAPPIAGVDLDLRDLGRLFAESRESGHPVTLSSSACSTLLTAMTTPPAQESRAVVLLTAAHALLQKQAIAPRTINVLFETVRYDGTDCDGLCLISDIENELGIDGEASPA